MGGIRILREGGRGLNFGPFLINLSNPTPVPRNAPY